MADKVRGASHWCEVCRCWVSQHAAAIRMHDQSDGHKEKLADKLKQARFKAQQAERDKEQAERSMSAIEAAAQKAYAADVAAAARPEDPFVAPVVSAGARARQAEEAARRELESAVDVELKRRHEETYRAAASCAPPVWVYDSALGYHRDGNNSGWLYDPKTQQYFCPATRAWGSVGPGSVGGEAEEEEYPLNPFSSGGGAAPHAAEAPRPSAPAATMPRQPPAAVPPPASSLPAAAMMPRSVAPPKPAVADGRTGITAFQLGFGTNHPAYEAARAKTGAAQARVLAAAGGSVMAVHGGPRGLGTVPAASPGVAKQAADAAVAASKRKAQQSGAAAAESEALARREAARKRMEERTKGMFGLT